MKTCYCRTTGCPSEGVPFDWDDSPTGGEDVVQFEAWCGGCSTQFTDIVAAEDPESKVEPGEVEEPTGP